MLFLDVIKSPDPKNRMNSLDIWLFRFFFPIFAPGNSVGFQSRKFSEGHRARVILYVNNFCKSEDHQVVHDLGVFQK